MGPILMFGLKPAHAPAVQSFVSLLSATLALSIVSVAIRVDMVFYGISSLHQAFGIAKFGLTNSYIDLALIWSFTAVLLIFIFSSTRRFETLPTIIAGVFYTFAITSVVLGCVNAVAVNLIGGSLTFQWIYYADFLRSFTAQSAVKSALSETFFLTIVISLVAFVVLTYVINRCLLIIVSTRAFPPIAVTFLVAMTVYFVHFSDKLAVAGTERGYVTNPLIELISTATASTAGGQIRLTEPIIPPRLAPASNNRDLLPADLKSNKIRNIVVFVMESVGANYVAGTGPQEAKRWTPKIAAYAGSTIAFRNVYAHVPYSTKSLFSLLTSQYPLFSFELEVTKLRNRSLPTLSGRLKDAGFRTAFFMSGDFEFQSVDKFLDGKGFDTLSDMRTIDCSIPKNDASTTEWPHGESVDDSCTGDALKHWLDEDIANPFFALLWTGNTHWPYYPGKEPAPGELSANEYQNRFLGAVQSSDAAIGSVIDHLAKLDLLKNTLVVVIGDHGEAFREHGFSTHNNTIYQEETHIPLLLINPQIHFAEPVDTLGGMIDIAPTILHVLGLPPEPSWEGRSLFDPARPERIFMFAPNQDIVAGYREGNKKYMYSETRNNSLVFDLNSDQQENHNIADQISRGEILGHLSGWLSKQDRLFK